jgi:hypothetical protein
MENRSKYDPKRKTVGSIYRDLQLHGEKQVITGDMNYELRSSLTVDLNDTIKQGTLDFDGRQFYITVHEKRDLQMKNTFIRRMIKTKYRPYPEDDTLVFKVIPYTNEVSFCWELPHRSNMLNMLNCPDLYPAEQLQLYRKWEMMRLEYFGFMKDEIGNWKENPFYAGDQVINKKIETQVSCSTHKILDLPEAS